MNDKIMKLAIEAGLINYIDNETPPQYFVHADLDVEDIEKFAELILQECIDQVNQAKNSGFVSLDDAKRMKHFTDVTKKRIKKHFGVE